MLLHGLWRTRRSMSRLARRLEASGYHVVNAGYASRRAPVEELADTVTSAVALCDPLAPLHVVTHSMGGILLRQALAADATLRRPSRVVMLGPPNHGSEVIDRLGGLPGAGWLLGPAGRQLGAGDDGIAARLPPLPSDVQLGVVAGDLSINLLLSRVLPGPDDGAVTVASTRLDGMAEHVVLPIPHPFLMTARRAVDHALHFLAHGAFPR